MLVRQVRQLFFLWRYRPCIGRLITWQGKPGDGQISGWNESIRSSANLTPACLKSFLHGSYVGVTFNQIRNAAPLGSVSPAQEAIEKVERAPR